MWRLREERIIKMDKIMFDWDMLCFRPHPTLVSHKDIPFS